ncbi:hypothetical protein [Paraburkholderia sp. HD33-4]|uniref:hypothetical protein n=1 Tax=Paraburkholderia sp. HD33-4 TaxID=2883242 RepID=UPI001F1AE79D|nr:hypothetical protein [Paraburkholderia sp. HD33-4]
MNDENASDTHDLTAETNPARFPRESRQTTSVTIATKGGVRKRERTFEGDLGRPDSVKEFQWDVNGSTGGALANATRATLK